jgi:hypothetical protein
MLYIERAGIKVPFFNTVLKANKDYERRRDCLIPEAEKYADRRHGKRHRNGESPEDHAARWNKCFSAAMERAVIKANLKA